MIPLEYQIAISDGWHRGMSELLKIAANARYFTDSSSIVPNDVSRGEAAAGMAIDFYAREGKPEKRLTLLAKWDAMRPVAMKLLTTEVPLASSSSRSGA